MFDFKQWLQDQDQTPAKKPERKFDFQWNDQSSPYRSHVEKAEQTYGIPQNLFARMLDQESRFNPAAVSPKGARGIAQIMPNYHPNVNPDDPVASIDYGAKYLRQIADRFGGDWDKAVAGYNAGPNAVDKRGMDNLPEETRNYLQRIMGGTPEAQPIQQPAQAQQQQPFDFANWLAEREKTASAPRQPGEFDFAKWLGDREREENRGFIGNVTALTGEGFRRLWAGRDFAKAAATGEFSDDLPKQFAKELSRYSHQPEELKRAQENLMVFGAKWEEAAGFVESAGVLAKMAWALGKEAATNPKGLAYFSAEQFANMVPAMAGMIAGGKVGAAAGVALGGPAALVTVPVGAFLGAAGGGAATEAGLEMVGFVADMLHENDLKPTEANIMKVLSQPENWAQIVDMTRKKAVGTAGTDALLTLASGGIAMGPARSAMRVARRSLGKGASRVALEAKAKDILATVPLWKKGGAAGLGVLTNIVGEGVSEAVGQKWATGEVDMGEVALEVFAGMGMAAPEVLAAIYSLRQKPASDDTAGGAKPGVPPPPKPVEQDIKDWERSTQTVDQMGDDDLAKDIINKLAYGNAPVATTPRGEGADALQKEVRFDELMAQEDAGPADDGFRSANVEAFVDRVMRGDDMGGPEDVQFYEENKEAIENTLVLAQADQATAEGADGTITPEAEPEVAPGMEVQPEVAEAKQDTDAGITAAPAQPVGAAESAVLMAVSQAGKDGTFNRINANVADLEPGQVKDFLDVAAKRGLVQVSDTGHYSLTEQGRAYLSDMKPEQTVEATETGSPKVTSPKADPKTQAAIAPAVADRKLPMHLAPWMERALESGKVYPGQNPFSKNDETVMSVDVDSRHVEDFMRDMRSIDTWSAAGLTGTKKIKGATQFTFERPHGQVRVTVRMNDQGVWEETVTIAYEPKQEKASEPAKPAEPLSQSEEGQIKDPASLDITPGDVLQINGKDYRHTGKVGKVNGKEVGQWEFRHEGKWHAVKSVPLRMRADKKAAEIAAHEATKSPADIKKPVGINKEWKKIPGSDSYLSTFGNYIVGPNKRGSWEATDQDTGMVLGEGVRFYDAANLVAAAWDKRKQAEKPKDTREPWQMTQREYQLSRAAEAGGVPVLNARDRKTHENSVTLAFNQGRDIPEHVLKDYPELQKQQDQEKPKFPADRVMGTKVSLAMHEEVDGVSFELYKPSDESAGGFTVVRDIETGKPIDITKYPTIQKATGAHIDLWSKAQKMSEGPKKSPTDATAPAESAATAEDAWRNIYTGEGRYEVAKRLGWNDRDAARISKTLWQNLTPAAQNVLTKAFKDGGWEAGATQAPDLTVSDQRRDLPVNDDLWYTVSKDKDGFVVTVGHRTNPSIFPIEARGDTAAAAYKRVVAKLREDLRDKVAQEKPAPQEAPAQEKPLTTEATDTTIETAPLSEVTADDLMAEWDRQAAEAEQPQKRPVLKERRDQLKKENRERLQQARQGKAEETKQHLGNALDALKQINAILGDKGQVGGQLDARKWDQIKPLLQLAWDEMVAAGKSAKEFVSLAIATLKPEGRPYFEKFVREEIDHGSVRDATEKAPAGKQEADVPGTDTVGGAADGLAGEVGSRPLAEADVGEVGDAGQHGGGDRDQGTVRVTPSDYRITEADQLGRGGPKQKYRNNVAAIRLLAELKNRPATVEDQSILAKYVGWGGLPQAFTRPDGTIATGWDAEARELKSLLGPEEYAAARASTQDAHYTSEPIIKSIYAALERFGFKGGKSLEPSFGIGNFAGLMPESVRNRSKITAIELDPTTAAIAKHLYPQQNVVQSGFQDVTLAPNSYDLAFGNPPFGDKTLYDPQNPDLKGFSIHNYFFAKSIKALRPNGILAMVVSSSMMDKKGGAQREWIARHTELLGAIRLPNTAFKENAGTEVTTDLIFLRKRADGEAATGHKWQTLQQVTGQDGIKYNINEYFVANPEMMLGDVGPNKLLPGEIKDGVYGSVPGLLARGAWDKNLLDNAIASLPAGIYKTGQTFEQVQKADILVSDIGFTQPYGYTVDDSGQAVRRLPDVNGEKVFEPVLYADKPIDGLRLERFKGILEIRDAVRRLVRAEIEDSPQMAFLRTRLNVVYDRFVAKYGHVSSAANADIFKGDPTDYPLLRSLEEEFDKGVSSAVARKTGEPAKPPSANKAAIFRVRTRETYRAADKADNAKDGLAIVLREDGIVDMDRIAALTGQSVEQVTAELAGVAFLNPQTQGWETADSYLSGNVKKKLREAQQAVQNDPRFFDNVQALEKVQPEDVPAEKIHFNVGATWVPASMYENFARDVLQVNDARIVYNENVNAWSISLAGLVTTQYQTDHKSAASIFQDMLRNKDIVVYDEDDTGKRFLQMEWTTQARAKAEEINRAFQEWAIDKTDRRDALASMFNEKVNTTIETKSDGSHMIFPGMGIVNAGVPRDDQLLPHQKNVAWRLIQKGKGLLDHVVGSGKTFAAIATGMEMKRMGLVKKPLYVVPNHLVEQWATEFQRLYPGANVLVIGKKDFAKAKRQEFLGRIATGTWDAVLLAHSSFGFIRMPAQYEAKFYAEQIQQYEDAIKELTAAEGKKSRTVKQMEKARDKLKEKLKALADRPKDAVVDFSELGVDALFVDEAHEFKNLFYVTGRQRVAGLGNPKGAKKSFDMFVKTQFVQDQNNGRGVFFMTGTPVSNSIAEMYTMMRYLDYGRLQEMGIKHFDQWANMFASTTSDWEVDPTGTRYRLQAKLEFANLPGLMSFYKDFADVVSTDDLRKMAADRGQVWPIPDVKGGKPALVVAERSDLQQSYMDWVVHRFDHMPNDPRIDNPLKATGDAMKASLDIRLIDPSLPDYEGSKVNLTVKNILTTYKAWADKKGTQLVFCDLSTPKKAAAKQRAEIAALRDAIRKAQVRLEKAIEDDVQTEREQEYLALIDELEKYTPAELMAADSVFSVYDDIKAKLISAGVPASEVAFIHDANTDKQKEELFGKVRSGRVRVMIGSTSKMGAGMNVQDRLVALHHLDAPWRPSDLEQREGRIIRQGNRFYWESLETGEKFEVEIFRYATNQTLDTRRWQVIERKAVSIGQLRAGNHQWGETLADATGEAVNAAEMKAASSGNPLILEEIQLRQEIKKQEALKKGARSERFAMERKIKESEDYDARFEDRVASVKENTERINSYPRDNTPQGWTVTVDDKVFRAEGLVPVPGEITSDDKDAVKASKKAISEAQDHNKAALSAAKNAYGEHLKKVVDRAFDVNVQIAATKLGKSVELPTIQYRGVDFVPVGMGMQHFVLRPDLKDLDVFYGSGLNQLDVGAQGFSAQGLLVRLDNRLNAIAGAGDTARAYMSEHRERLRQSAANATKALEKIQDFEPAIQRLREKHETVLRELARSKDDAGTETPDFSMWTEGQTAATPGQPTKKEGAFYRHWGGKEYTLIENAKLLKDFPVPAFVYKLDDKEWAVVEASTGAQLSEGDTRTEAISRANQKLESNGLDKFQEVVKRYQEKHGLSPWSGNEKGRPSFQRRTPQTQTKAFKDWFGKSKVVDESGDPLVVYHGTVSGRFRTFRKGRGDNLFGRTHQRPGIGFHLDKPLAETYANEKEISDSDSQPRVIEAYLKAEKIWDYENPRHLALAQAALAKHPEYESWMSKELADGDWEAVESRPVQDAIKTAGFDAFYSNDHPGKAINVYQSSQVRNAKGPDALFSMRESAARGTLQASDVSAVTDALAANWANAPKIEVVQTQAELPDGTLSYLKSIGAENDIVDGVFYKGTIYVVADNQASAETVTKTVMHEAFGHYGARGSMGKRWGSIMDGIYRAKRAEAQKIAQDYGFDLRDQEGRRLAADEWFSREVVNNPNSMWVNRVIAQVRQWLREMFPKLSFSRREILGLLDASRRYVEGQRQGGDMAGAGALSKAQKAPAWYSQMQRVLEAKLPASGTPDQFKQMIQSWSSPPEALAAKISELEKHEKQSPDLAKTFGDQDGGAERLASVRAELKAARKEAGKYKGEFKSEELAWMGLAEWLDEQTGKVTKQQVLDFVAANNVELKEVSRGEVAGIMSKRLGLESRKVEIVRRMRELAKGVEPISTEEGREYDALREERDLIDLDLKRLSNAATTKFSHYQLPGGENYREVLLTLPEKGISYEVAVSEFKSAGISLDITYGVEGLRPHEYKLRKWGTREFVSPEELSPHLKSIWSNLKTGIGSDSKDFHSSHFPNDPNTIAHVRVNDFTGPAGEKALNLEEVQTDITQMIRDLGKKVRAGKATSAEKSELARLKKITPFHTTAKASMLIIKRMVRYAAENGYELVTWPPGQVQADRYDLSKHIKEINYEQDTDGSDNYSFQAIGHNGTEVIGEEDIDIARIEKLAGKEIAEKIKAGEGRDDSSEYRSWKSLSGLDLKVGGEGLKVFYDKILPAEVNKFFNKAAWGRAKVGTVEINSPTLDGQTHRSLKDRRDQLVGEQAILEKLGSGMTDAEFTRFNNQRTELEELNERIVILEREAKDVWSLPITPEMRQKALREGMPLFQRDTTDMPLFSRQPEKNKETPLAKGVRAVRKIKDKAYAKVAGAEPGLMGKALDEAAATIQAIKEAKLIKGGFLDKLLTTVEWSDHPVEKKIFQATQDRELDKRQIFYNIDHDEATGKNGWEVLKALKNRGMSIGARIRGRDLYDRDNPNISTEYQQVWDAIDHMDVTQTFWEDQPTEQIDSAKFRESTNFVEAVVADQQSFDKGGMDGADFKTAHSYRGVREDGVSFLIGKTKEYPKLHLVRFAKDSWTQDSAQKWLADNALQLTGGEGYKTQLEKQGTSAEVIEAIGIFRASQDKALDHQMATVKEVMEAYEKAGQEPPVLFTDKNEQGDDTGYTLADAYNEMGTHKGYYSPRIRESGDWMVLGDKDGQKYMFKTTSRRQALKRILQLRREGFKNLRHVEDQSSLPESVYVDLTIGEVSKALESAVTSTAEGMDPKMAQRFRMEVLRQASDMLKARAFRARRIARKAGEVTKGYIEDPLTRHVLAVNQLAGGIAKGKAAERMFNAYLGTFERYERNDETSTWDLLDDNEEILDSRPMSKEDIESKKKVRSMRYGGLSPSAEKHLHGKIKDYIANQLRNQDRYDRLVGLGKSIVSFNFLGFNARSALVNTTAMLQTAPPAILQYALGGKGSLTGILRAITRAGVDYSRVMRGTKLPNADEQKFMEQIQQKGYDAPQYMHDALGALTNMYGSAWSNTMHAAMKVFGITEQWNRGATMLAAYRLARAADKTLAHDQAIEKATDASNKAHGIYGPSTLPSWAQGQDPGALILRMGYTYQKFAHNYVQMLADLGFKRKNIKAVIFALAAPAVMGGAKASLVVTTALLAAKGMLMVLGGGDDDPEKFVFDTIREELGPWAERTARYGAFGAMGFEISGSLAVGMEVPRTLMDLTGPFGGLYESMADSWRYLGVGQPYRALEKLAPRALENPLAAIREARQGATTKTSRPIWGDDGRKYQPGPVETAWKVAGFRGSERATVQDRQWESRRMEARFDDRRQRIYERYRAYISNPKRNEKEMTAIQAEVKDYNARVKKAGLGGLVPYITPQALRRQAKGTTQPTRKERMRLAG